MLLPARVKHRKLHRGRRTGVATQGADLAFGEFGLQASEAAWMTNRQIEAARRVMTRFVRRGGQVFIRVFPDKSVTKKPAETRMGSGKGAPEGWVVVIKPGRVLFEMGGVTPEMAKRAFQLAAYKLPMKTRTLGIRSGVKAAADVKIKGPAELKPGEGVEGIAGAAAAPTAIAAAPARGPKAAPGAAPSVKPAPGAAPKAAPGAAPKAVKDSRQELFNLRFQMATGQLQNHRQIRHVRHDLAQILTEIFLKERTGAPAPAPEPVSHRPRRRKPAATEETA